MGFQLVALSADQPSKLEGSLKKNDLSYTLLSDHRMEAARAFGVAFHVSDGEVQRLSRFGIDLEAASGLDHHLLPVPSVFLVDAAGIVRFRHYEPDYKVRLPTARLLEEARKIQSSESKVLK